MREAYEEVEMTIVEFDEEDVISTSGLSYDDYEGGVPDVKP